MTSPHPSPHGEARTVPRRARTILAAALAVSGLVAVADATGPVDADPASGVGPITVDESGHWFEYAGNGEPYFMAGSGGPEGFLYYSDSRKQDIVDQLIANDVRAVYLHAVRSNGGDGSSDENPFIQSGNPSSGVDPAVLDEWDTYLSQLDEAGIVIWFHLYDDGARPFGACNPDLPAAEQAFVKTIVERFRDYQHLVWLPTEEHVIKACGDNSVDIEKAKALAAEIRLHDDVHPLGVHHNNGQSNQYLGNDDIDVFAQQVCQQSQFASVDGLHDAGAFGEDVYVMAECHPWHKDLLDAGDRTSLRRSFWSSVMAGGYVLFYDAWESTDPTPGMLADLGRINAFMDTTRFSETGPADQLAAAGTKWVLANEAADVYILYSNTDPSSMGVQGMSAGSYALGWFDPNTGQRVSQTVTVGSGTASFPVPNGLGPEVAVSIEPADGPPPTTTQPPVTTTEPPVTTTTEPPVTTTEPPVTTTEPPVTTTEPPVTTTEPPVTTVPPPPGPIVELAATDDAYLQGSTAFDASRLRVESGNRVRTSFVRFDTSGVVAATSERLELLVGDDPGAGTLTVWSGDGGTWTESTLTVANAPTPGDELASVDRAFSTGQVIGLDLPVDVIDGDELDLVIQLDGAGSNDVAFVSSEGGDGPRLVVERDVEPTPTTAPPTTAPPTTAPPTTAPPTTAPPVDEPVQTVTFTGTDDPVANPERGFHEGVSVADSTNGSTTSVAQMTSMYDDGIRLARMYVRLDDFRGAPLDPQLLADLDEVFDRARTAGIKLVPRFTYNFGSAPDATVDRIEEHLDQLAPVLQANADVISVLQAGFIGAWGEWHSSSNGLTNPADRARVRAALLDALPVERMIQLRYPDDLIELEPAPLDAADAWSGSDRARTGHKNDCFLANEHDAGTYIPLSRKGEFQSYLDTMTEFTAMGGETCQVSLSEQRTDCPTALAELERFHWDYLNLDFYGPTIERWRTDGCFDEIEQRLGYRYRLVEVTAPTKVEPGGSLDLRIGVANDGFGKLYNPRPLDIVLVDVATGVRVNATAVTDARTVLPSPGESTELELTVELPAGLSPGTYRLHLELPDGAASLAGDPRYSVRFANSGTWRPSSGLNDLLLDVTVGEGGPPVEEPPVDEPPVDEPPTPLVLAPIADAYLQDGSGVDGDLLRVESGARTRVSHLVFDTSSVADTASATLVLTVGADEGAGTITIHRGEGGTWTGGALTSANAADPGEPLASVSGEFAVGDVLAVPVGPLAGSPTTLVVTTDAQGADDVSFVASGDAAGPVLRIAG